jgi:hypothetical protein
MEWGCLGDNLWNDHFYSATDTVTWVRARHAIKATSYNYLAAAITSWLGSGSSRSTATSPFRADFEMGRASGFRQNNG